MRLKTCTLLLLILSVCQLLYGQNSARIIELEKNIAAQKMPAKKLRAYHELINEVADYDSVATEKYCRLAIPLAQKLKDKKTEALIELQYGVMYMYYNDVSKCLAHYNQSLKLAAEAKAPLIQGDVHNSMSNLYAATGDDKRRDASLQKALQIYQKEKSEEDVALVYANMGANYNRNSNYVKAAEYLLKALAIREKLKNEWGAANVAFNITHSFMMLKRYADALKYNSMAIEKFTKAGDEGPLANCYAVRSAVLRRMGKATEAAAYAQKAIPIASKYHNTACLRAAYDELGLINAAKGENKAALSWYNRSRTLSVADSNKQGIVSSNINLAQVSLDLHDLKTAERYMTEAEPMAHKNDLKEELAEIYKLKFQLYVAQNRPQMANKAFDAYEGLRDSLRGIEVNRQVTEVQTRYETAKKDNRINLLTKENKIRQLEVRQRNAVIIAIAALLLGGAIAGYAFYKRNLAKQQAKLQAEVYKQQEIATRSLFEGEQKERVRIARDLHDSIGQMLSVVKMNLSQRQDDPSLNDTLSLVDETITEVRHISHNLIPEELNFGLFSALEDLAEKINAAGNTQVITTIPDEARAHQFEKANELSVYRIVQEVLSNMVRHAQATEIALSVLQQDGLMTLVIRDNGKGFDTSLIGQSKGLGWKNIAARVNMLNGNMQVSSERLSGTQIEITIPG
ncbi:tetratricopeptide repeat protein [Mucilaginibacter limnophilus]|uniref:histidine kinase n=1 Tax=Mucilaginibacter limnophilus TaxID=1932778 RepID=A0A437MWQ8_9SPHI|nr:sensor histidine kinase [Mucilaginibacter limnophilus]RVU02077.1 tetratricopeptide repeat protein [Mucilaginibacter limnophilus]